MGGEELRDGVSERYAGAATLGCGNPTVLATLSPGEVVLGSGGGIDVLLLARKKVSPGGKAYGLDMTDEMLELAEKNRADARQAGGDLLHGRGRGGHLCPGVEGAGALSPGTLRPRHNRL